MEAQSTLTTELGRQIAQVFPGLMLADDPHSRRTYSKDLWPRNLILAREEALSEPTIDVVAWPESVSRLAEFVREAGRRDWQLYPYGAGSGVCGGLTPAREQVTPRVVVDLKRMDQIESIDETSLVAKVQAGMMGQVLEEDLNARGYTMGHFPSSIYCSSFGGYLATRAAGQLSTYYGKIEDVVLAIEGVLPSGEIFTTPLAPRLSVGPDWNHVFMGSEGTLGFLTAAWVKVHRMAEERRFLSFEVSSTVEALEGVRTWLQEGLRPAAVRIYDEDESALLMGVKGGRVKMVSVVEGATDYADFTVSRMVKIIQGRKGWNDTGEEPAQHWWAHRYDISYRQQQIMSHRRMILDTFEVSTVWSKLPALHRAVKDVTAKFKDEKGELLIILAHFSHFYHCGGNIYFTLCGRSGENSKTADFYDRVWDAMLKACEEQGAAISHHHGIGRLKAKAFARQRGVLFDVFKRLKNELDPKHFINPENLGV